MTINCYLPDSSCQRRRHHRAGGSPGAGNFLLTRLPTTSIFRPLGLTQATYASGNNNRMQPSKITDLASRHRSTANDAAAASPLASEPAASAPLAVTNSSASGGRDLRQRGVPLLDIPRENAPLGEELQAAMHAVCQSGRFVMGPECEQFEQEIAAYCQVKHAVGCASGSDALLLALMALDIQAGDEVIVPSFTFFATASAVTRLGAVPVFVDIRPDSFNLCPTQVARAISPRTKVIIPVHLFGQAAEMNSLNALAHQHGLRVVEDAAQAIGACYHDQALGTWGDIGCFSFYPTKNLGGFGDGGMLTTNDDSLADRLRLLRTHGMRPRYYHREVGINSRLDTLQAAILSVKLRQLPAWTEARRRHALRYAELFAQAGLSGDLELPAELPGCRHVWNQYTIRVRGGKRDELREYLQDKKIGTEIYYPVPLHQQDCFRSLHPAKQLLPVTERLAKSVLSLPVFPALTMDEQDAVVQAIAAYFQRQPGSSRHRPAGAHLPPMPESPIAPASHNV